MSKKTFLWFLLAILGVFIVFCIVTKLPDKSNEHKQYNKIEKPRKNNENIVLSKTTKVEDKQPKHSDIHFKIYKEKDEVSISGLLNSKNDFISLSSKYLGLKEGELKFDKSAYNQKVIGLALSLNSILDKFKSGYIEYYDNNFILNGVVNTQEDKELIEATINSISGFDIKTNIIIENPKIKKQKRQHIGKLSITKQGNDVTISGIFSSQKEIDSLVELLKSKDLDVKKELCIVDSDLKEDRWKVPFVLVVDDFVEFTQGTIQFDKDSFSIIGETKKEGIKEDIDERLAKIDENINISNEVRFIESKSKIEKIQEKVDSILKLKSLRFITATGTLLDESKPILDEVADILLENPNIKVEIAGYTDSDGEEKTNLILSQHRADTVRKYLIKRGVNPKNLKAIGYGEAKPLVENNSEENKQINRRVEFIILGE